MTEIRTWAELAAINTDATTLADDYILMNNLSSADAGYDTYASSTANGGEGWEPIGIFTGTFDGQGYTISDLFMDRGTEIGVALFGDMRGVVSNVGLINVNITGSVAVGAIIGDNFGIIKNSYSTGTVGGGSYVGGLIGQNVQGWRVYNSHSTANVSGGSRVGGLMGDAGGLAFNSYATGDVSGDEMVGGFAGSLGAAGSNTFNCYSTGNVTRNSGSVNVQIGGFVGDNRRSGIINCYSTGSVHYTDATDPTDKGFAGSVDTDGDYAMFGNYWDTETSGQTTTAGDATGKTTAEMQSFDTFEYWRIAKTTTAEEYNLYFDWNIVDTATYPYLPHADYPKFGSVLQTTRSGVYFTI